MTCLGCRDEPNYEGLNKWSLVTGIVSIDIAVRPLVSTRRVCRQCCGSTCAAICSIQPLKFIVRSDIY